MHFNTIEFNIFVMEHWSISFNKRSLFSIFRIPELIRIHLHPNTLPYVTEIQWLSQLTLML